MFQPHISTPEAKANPQSFPFLNGKRIESFSTNENCKHNYTRYSELSDGSQTSFFTPGASSTKKKVVLDDITNLLNNVNPKRLDFSGSIETASSKGQTPNYIIKKIDMDKSVHMEIEDIETIESVVDSEKLDESAYGSTMMDGFIQSSDTWNTKRTKTGGNSQEYSRSKQKNPSLIGRWKKNDKIFQGKYSTGTTPKITKKTMQNTRKTLVPFKRSNTDVPPTLESDKVLISGDKPEIGANKFINNLLGTSSLDKQPESAFQAISALSKKPMPKPLFMNMNNKHTQLGLKPFGFAQSKLLCDLPLGLPQNNPLPKLNCSTGPGLFLIPEKSSDQDRFSLFGNGSPMARKQMGKMDLVSKLLTFEEEDEEEAAHFEEDKDIEIANEENVMIRKMIQEDEDMNSPIFRQCSPPSKGFASPKPKKDFHTPTKKNDHFTEVKFNFFNTVTAKKEVSKVFPTEPDSGRKKPVNHFGSKLGFDGAIPEVYECEKTTKNSRFEQDYEIIEILGSGNFGTVYKCQNKLDGLIYAVKCTKNKLKGKSNVNQALNEAQALASLSVLDENPFIVRYYSTWIEDNRLYLAMEHCQSNLKTLRHQHVRFSESMIRQIMRDICMGLKHLHNQKIVHLDIKPENILYSKTKKYKIADLGLSRIAQRSNNEDINEGDCRYLAPELLKDYPDHQLPDLTKADIFSFGATIYELMIGCDLPKNGNEWANLRDGNLTKLDQLNYSNSLKSMLRSMMNNNPDSRPSAHELLANFLQSEIELELKWEKKQNKILKERVKELEGQLKLRAKRKNSV